MFTDKDIKYFNAKGINKDMVEKQMAFFMEGIRPLELDRPAIPGDGIEVFDEGGVLMYAGLFDKNAHSYSKVKFVPASGAASRMFKDLFEALNELLVDPYHQKYWIEQHPEIKKFFANIYRYPFIYVLEEICNKKNTNLDALIADEKYAEILHLILSENGLNYGNTPKGALRFHRYPDHNRTAIEEHLIEAEQYLLNKDKSLHIHFTVSPEHQSLFETITDQQRESFREKEINIDVHFSVQNPSTDTIAVDPSNDPFRDEEGNILFRPGGHGALLKNLESLDEELIFIVNIDNIAPDRLKPFRVLYKKLLGGYLIEKLNVIRQLLHNLENDYSIAVKNDVLEFTKRNISYKCYIQLRDLKSEEFISEAFRVLNRPVRVCGMVKNTGEPGGGPFWIVEDDGTVSKQVIESSQINMYDPEQRKIFASSTHFNPVDIACCIRDYKGFKFNLAEFRDDNMAFISKKSVGGRSLKALESPGLWNGGMAGWLTFFIDVPLETFTPVKTVFDFLRPEHLQDPLGEK